MLFFPGIDSSGQDPDQAGQKSPNPDAHHAVQVRVQCVKNDQVDGTVELADAAADPDDLVPLEDLEILAEHEVIIITPVRSGTE